MRRLFLALILLSITLLITACSYDRSKINQIAGPYYGFNLSPKSFEGSDFSAFFEEAVKAGNTVTWAGDWKELEKTSSTPYTITNLGSTYTYLPIALVGYYNQGAGTMHRPLTSETKESYKTGAINYVKKYFPKYFGMGVEVNIMREKSPEEFSEFVNFYNEMYDEIKDVSPDTKVFTVFQLERMKGLKGGLFGGKNDISKTEWDILDDFKLDLVGFTTYPDIIYAKPEDIPANYYSEISTRTDKPVGFFESGWHTSAFPKGYEGSEEKQSTFVERFLTDAKSLNAEVVIWSFLYDASDAAAPFDTTGLIRDDETKRSAYSEWLKGIGRE